MKKEGYKPSTIERRAKILKVIWRHTDLKAAEAIKRAIGSLMTLLAEGEESAVSKWVPRDGRLFREFFTYPKSSTGVTFMMVSERRRGPCGWCGLAGLYIAEFSLLSKRYSCPCYNRS